MAAAVGVARWLSGAGEAYGFGMGVVVPVTAAYGSIVLPAVLLGLLGAVPDGVAKGSTRGGVIIVGPVGAPSGSVAAGVVGATGGSVAYGSMGLVLVLTGATGATGAYGSIGPRFGAAIEAGTLAHNASAVIVKRVAGDIELPFALLIDQR